MALYREIVTKAVIGKGKKYFKNNYNLLAEHNANTILGCWVINHKFKGTVVGDKVVIDGNFDINIWYSYDEDKKTGVATKNISYTETVNVKTKTGTSIEGSDIIVRALKQPSCSNVKIKDDVIDFDIEKELGIEVVNDAKVKIAIEDDEDPWDTIDDDIEEVDKKIDDSDILRFQIATEDENYTKINEYHEEDFESMCGYDAFKYLSSYHFVEPAWCYVIRKNYYIENKFSFKKGVYHEDFGLIPYVIYKARKVKSIDFIGYYYIQRNGSIMNNNDYKKTVKKAFDMIEQYKTMRLFAKNINRKNNLDDYFLSYISNSVIVKARELKKDEKKVYINELKKLNVFDGVLVNTRIRRFKKYLMKHNLNLYLKVVR